VQRRPGDKMHLGPEQTAAFVRRVLAEGTYVVCHKTLTYGDPDFGPATVKPEGSWRDDARACDLGKAAEQRGLLFDRPGATR
jgi:hypothetical protein